MTEATIQAALLPKIRAGLPGSVVTKHSERLVAGVPDVSVSWRGLTTWWELEHWNPKRSEDPRQDFLIAKLSVQAPVRYVIYLGSKHKHGPRTLVAAQLVLALSATFQESLGVLGYNHDHVVTEIKRLYKLRGLR